MTDDELLQEMIDPAPHHGDVSRWRRLGATAAIFALAGLGITSLTTNALFTDRETTAGDLLTGTVDLGLDGTQTFDETVSGMAPGDSVAKTITVTNNGSLALRYVVSYQTSAATSPLATAPSLGPDAQPAASDDLRRWMTLTVAPVSSASQCQGTPDTTKDGEPPANSLSTSDTTFTPALGDYQTEPFSHARVLGVSDSNRSDLLCAVVTFDIDAGNALQATGTKITLRFDAEQVVNNTSGTDTPVG